MLADRICVKYGELIDRTEEATMRFVAENTSIPVPKVLCAFTHRDYTLHCDGKNPSGHDRTLLD